MDAQSPWLHLKQRNRLSLIVTAVSLAVLILGSVASGLLQNPGFTSINYLRALPLVPIFAALNRRDDHVVFVNETDLGYRAESPFPLPDEQPPSKIILKPNAPETIPLGQPDRLNPRQTSRSEISLQIADIEAALAAGRDHARVNNHHEKHIVDLPTGEQAVWITVPHFNKYLRYNSGLLYTLREGRPVILFQLSGAHEFFLRDFDEDGFLEIARVVDKAFAWTHWELYRYDNALGYFVETSPGWHWFPLRYTVQHLKVLVSLVMPLIFALTLAAWLRRHWLTLLVNAFVQLYLLLVVVSIGVIGTMNFFPMTWAVIVSVFLIALMNLSRSLTRKTEPAPAADTGPTDPD